MYICIYLFSSVGWPKSYYLCILLVVDINLFIRHWIILQKRNHIFAFKSSEQVFVAVIGLLSSSLQLSTKISIQYFNYNIVTILTYSASTLAHLVFFSLRLFHIVWFFVLSCPSLSLLISTTEILFDKNGEFTLGSTGLPQYLHSISVSPGQANQILQDLTIRLGILESLILQTPLFFRVISEKGLLQIFEYFLKEPKENEKYVSIIIYISSCCIYMNS